MLLACISALTISTAGFHSDDTRPPLPSRSLLAEAGKTSDTMAVAQAQTQLARAGFSPGLIDGRQGRKTTRALAYVDRARAAGLEIALPSDAWTKSYTITAADAALITGPIPADWDERAALPVSGYADFEDLLCERGQCSLPLLALLNPNLDMAAVVEGTQVIIPDATAVPVPLERLHIALREQVVLGFNDAGVVVYLAPCSIAADAAKRPLGEFVIHTLVTDPDYTFDPAAWPDAICSGGRLRIAPGPRNPVGSAWIGLDKPGYGLHGTPRPQDIGKTGSHGCFRLANWDALRLALAVDVSIPVHVSESLEAQPAARPAALPTAVNTGRSVPSPTGSRR